MVLLFCTSPVIQVPTWVFSAARVVSKLFNKSRRSGDDGARLQWAEHLPSRMKGQSNWSYDPSVNLFPSLLLLQAPLSRERDGLWRMPQPLLYLVVRQNPSLVEVDKMTNDIL